MGLFDAIDASGSALSAERLRMDVTAENLANAQSTRGTDGAPYRRKVVVLEQRGGGFGQALTGAMRTVGTGGSMGPSGPRTLAASHAGAGSAPVGGVEVAGIAEDEGPERLVYDPAHPDADPQGYVRMPNVNPVTEMVDLIGASRAYEANVTAMQAAKAAFTKTLELLR